MKLFLIGTLLFSGSGAAAMQNEAVNQTVTDVYQNVRQRVQKRVKETAFDSIRETGFPYPTEERLSSLTEDQQFAITSTIDQVNGTYEWGIMTNDEIEDALVVVQEELSELCDELGIELSGEFIQNHFRQRIQTKTNTIIRHRILNNLKENGIEYPNETRLVNLTEEQIISLLAKIDELNTTYDWVDMTDEEILEAMTVIKLELQDLREELGIRPIENQVKQNNYTKGTRGKRS